MSLAMILEVGSQDGASRLTAATGALMSGVLVMVAWEQWQAGLATHQWLLPVLAALGCATWCLVLLRRLRRPRNWRTLQVAGDGAIRLVDRASDEYVDADVMMTWGLGRLIYLRVRPRIKVDPAARPAPGQQSTTSFLRSGDCRFLFARWSFSEAHWHGLRRWLVWYRRSGHGESVLA